MAKLAIAEIQFARKLASNDLDTRQHSERLLKKWLSNKAKKGMDDTEICVLWKGLFASMFMSDKPLVQEQLASDLSKLIHLFPDYRLGVKFCQIFFDTLSREWHGIDRLRLDKYYMFIRCFVNQSFVYLQAQGWPEMGVQEFITAVTIHHGKCPGLILHIAELFLPELHNAATKKLPDNITLILLKPWLEIAAHSKDKIMVKLIQDNIIERIGNGHKVRWLSLNWEELGSMVWTLASNENTITRNRKILHRFHSLIMEKMKKKTDNI